MKKLLTFHSPYYGSKISIVTDKICMITESIANGGSESIITLENGNQVHVEESRYKAEQMVEEAYAE